MIPNFVLIIGAMKSGTTSLFNLLAQHPQIATGREKEPAFFSSDEKWARGLDWYESKFDFDPSRHKYALDASIAYTTYPFGKNVAERIKASAPRKFKLIYLMRHPLRRLESQALFSELTKTELGQRARPFKPQSFDVGIPATAIPLSLYAYQLDRFSEFYDKGDVLLLTLEQLKRDAPRTLAKIYEFLEIDKSFPSEPSLQSNPTDSHLVAPPMLSALFEFPPVRAIARVTLPKAARHRIYEVATIWARPRGRFNLNAKEELALIAAFSSDLVRLRDKYKVDIEKEWGIAL